MAKLGELRVDLTAGTGPFKEGIKGAGESVKGFIGHIFSLKTVIATALAGFGIERVVSNFNQAASSVDTLGKASKRLGVSVETLSALKFAAGESAIDFETLAKMAGKASKNLAEVGNTGQGSAAGAVRDLGLNLKDAAGHIKTFDQILPDIVRGMKDLDSPTQLDLATKIFGKNGGDEFVTWLKESGDLMGDLARQTEVARRIGVIFTDDQVEKLTKYHDAIERIDQAWLGLKVRVMTAVAPFLTEFANKLTGFVAGIPDLLSNIGTLIHGAITGELGEKAKLDLARIGLALLDIGEHIAMGMMMSVVEIVRAGFKVMPQLLGAAAAEAANLLFVQPFAKAVATFWETVGMKEFGAKIRFGATVIGVQADGFSSDKIADAIREIRGEAGSTLAPFGEWSKEMIHLSANLFDATDDLIGFTAAIKAHNPELAKAIEQTDAYGKAAGKAKGPLSDFFKGAAAGFAKLKADSLNVAKFGEETFESFGRGISHGIGDALTQAELHAKSFGEAVRETMASVVESVITAINQFLILRAVTAGFGAFFPASTGGGGGSTTTVPTGGGGLLGGLTPPSTPGGLGGPSSLRYGGPPEIGPQQTVIQVIDQRRSGERPSVETTQGPDGTKTISIMIRDEVGKQLGGGSFDRVLGSSFGVTRRGIRR